MRILSQDGMIDMPYEQMIINIDYQNKNKIVACGVSCDGENSIFHIADYSTEAKAKREMEMLREQCMKLFSATTFLQGGTELFAKSISQQEAEDFSMEYKNMNVFQFPADDKVGV